MKCSILNCPNTDHNRSEGLHFFRFPSNEEYYKIWVEKTGKIDYVPHPRAVVCSRHFEEHFLLSFRCKKVLKCHAIPTLFTSEHKPRKVAKKTIIRLPKLKNSSKAEALIHKKLLPKNNSPINVQAPLLTGILYKIENNENKQISAENSNVQPEIPPEVLLHIKNQQKQLGIFTENSSLSIVPETSLKENLLRFDQQENPADLCNIDCPKDKPCTQNKKLLKNLPPGLPPEIIQYMEQQRSKIMALTQNKRRHKRQIIRLRKLLKEQNKKCREQNKLLKLYEKRVDRIFGSVGIDP